MPQSPAEESPTVHFWTSALVPQSGGTADRAYRICKEILLPFVGPAFKMVNIDDEGRYAYFKGRVSAEAVGDIVKRLHAALSKVNPSDEVTLIVQEMGVFYLNSGPSAFFEPFDIETGGEGDDAAVC